MLVSQIRYELQKELGKKPDAFVVEITTDRIEIVERKNVGKRKSGVLKKVIINNIPCDNSAYHIWRINLENKVQGFSPLGEGNKTVDIALAFVKGKKIKKFLNVFLIELKSEIKDILLEETLKKFEDSISRFYFLLSINDHDSYEEFKGLKIRFAGIVFYNGRGSATQDDRIHAVFNKTAQKGLLECQTLLGKLKIPLKFFKNFESQTGTIQIRFEEMEKEINQLFGSL
ncbi:hypothetical protein PN36_18970 [Candidatus Thiomargarita nelsonii]|uniref:Uncharacterized protein n=1 Tax=Candidatus Thiomargarita nelsonii TaxID=1003181 RepID=A0A0A6RPG7_9GAMM|nr:hypothetical protein PN36_18970 [Candidatus Thiomargarita nelsonii]